MAAKQTTLVVRRGHVIYIDGESYGEAQVLPALSAAVAKQYVDDGAANTPAVIAEELAESGEAR